MLQLCLDIPETVVQDRLEQCERCFGYHLFVAKTLVLMKVTVS